MRACSFALVRSVALVAFVLGFLLMIGAPTAHAAEPARGATAGGAVLQPAAPITAPIGALLPKPTANGGFTISMSVEPAGTSARITISTGVPARGTLYYGPANGPVTEKGDRGFFVRRSMPLNDLAPGTTYYYAFVAGDMQGNLVNSEVQSFGTLKKRYRVAIERIFIDQDGDLTGAGEPIWDFAVELTQAGIVRHHISSCYPYNKPKAQQTRGVNLECVEGSTSEADSFGVIAPRNSTGGRLSYIFPAEAVSADATIRLYADADEADPDKFRGGSGPNHAGDVQHVWHLARAADGKTTVTLRADDTDGYDFKSLVSFSLEVFYDNESYTENGGFYSTWR